MSDFLSKSPSSFLGCQSLDFRPTLIEFNLIFIWLHLQRSYFQTNSYSPFLGRHEFVGETQFKPLQGNELSTLNSKCWLRDKVDETMEIGTMVQHISIKTLLCPRKKTLLLLWSWVTIIFKTKISINGSKYSFIKYLFQNLCLLDTMLSPKKTNEKIICIAPSVGELIFYWENQYLPKSHRSECLILKWDAWSVERESSSIPAYVKESFSLERGVSQSFYGAVSLELTSLGCVEYYLEGTLVWREAEWSAWKRERIEIFHSIISFQYLTMLRNMEVLEEIKHIHKE
jgi:hypothetical protein